MHDQFFTTYTSGNYSTTGTLQMAKFEVFNQPELKVKRLDPNAVLPVKAKTGDLGYDLFALERTVIQPGVVTKVRTGIAVRFPKGYGGLIRDRSSVATKAEVFTVAGVIDELYTGEIIVAFYNPGRVSVHQDRYNSATGNPVWVTEYNNPHVFESGDKIAQMILTHVVTFPVLEADDLGVTERGSDGFGSTGK